MAAFTYQNPYLPPYPLTIATLNRLEEAVYHLTLNLSSMTTQTLEMTAKLDVILDRLFALIPTPSPSPPKPPPTTTPMSAPPPLAVSHHPELKTVAPMAPLMLLQFHSTNRHIQLSRPLPLSLRTAHQATKKRTLIIDSRLSESEQFQRRNIKKGQPTTFQNIIKMLNFSNAFCQAMSDRALIYLYEYCNEWLMMASIVHMFLRTQCNSQGEWIWPCTDVIEVQGDHWDMSPKEMEE
ncbi:hypothetical protein JHK87_018205 [Glycine soja]|nr:hypothetical protein JHK87_018205 [Glycine soja]